MIDFTLVFKQKNSDNPIQFSIKMAVVKGIDDSTTFIQNNNYSICDYRNCTSLTDVYNALPTGSSGIANWYTFDTYIDSVSESNKIDVTAYVLKTTNSTYDPVCINLVDNETGTCMAFGVSNETIGSEMTHYIAINLAGTEYNLDSSMTVTKDNIKTFLLKWKDYYTSYIRYNGLMRASRAFLVLMAVRNSDSYIRIQAGYATNINSSFSSDFCCTFWDVYKMFSGEFYFSPQYILTNDGKKIYLTLQVTPGTENQLFAQNTNVINPDKIGCKPLLCYDYQSGTNLGQYLKPNTTELSPLLLKNGTTLYEHDNQQPSNGNQYFRAFPYTTIKNQVDPENIIEVTSYSNVSMVVNSSRINSHSDYTNYMKQFYYYNTYLKYGTKIAAFGPYLICSSDAEDGGVAYYIDENEGQGENFWNNFPTAPLTFGYIVPVINVGTDMNNHIAELESELNIVLRGGMLVTQQIGYYNSSSSMGNWYCIGLNSSQTAGLNTNENYVFPYSGKYDVRTADNTRVLWGISSAVDPGGPVGPGGAIGGGSSGSHAGGGGSFNDQGDNIGYSMGNSFGYSDSIVNWYIGELGSNTLSFNLQRLANWFKSPIDPDASLVQNMFYKYSDKLSNICSLKVVYSPEAASTDGWEYVSIHGQEVKGTTEITTNPMQGKPVTNQFKQTNIRLNFRLDEYFGSFLDYAPHTKVQIYLPFAGVHELDPSHVVGKDLTLQCTVNFLSGDIVYNIRINTGTSNSILYTFSGNCSIDLPLTSQDYDGKVKTGVNTILGIAAAGALGAASGGIGASIAGVVTEMSGASAAALAGGVATLGAGSIIAQSTPGVKTTGSFGGNTGVLSPMKAYLIVTRPKMVQAEKYGEIYGYPCMKSYKLKNISEYVKISDWHLSVPGATNEEITEIDRLAKTEGMIL